MYGKGPFGRGLEFTTALVNGVCPTCSKDTMFISLDPSYYRCTACGSDLEQKINGKISYIPAVGPGTKITLGFDGPQKI